MNYYNGPNPQYIPPPVYSAAPNPWYKPIRRNANIVGFGLLLVLLLGIFLSPVFSLLENFFVTGLDIKSPQILSLIESVVDLAVYLLMFMIPLTIMRLWIGIPVRVAFPMRNPRTSIAVPAVLFCLGASVIGMFSATAVSTFIQSMFGVSSALYPNPKPIGWSATAVYLLHVTVAAAILEELVFRGVILQSLRRFGDTFALVCSSALFGLVHHNLEQSIMAFVIGLAIGFFVLRSGSLKTGMLIHFVYNSIATVIDFATTGLSDKAEGIASMLIVSVYVVAGLIGFALLQAFHGGSFDLARSDYPVPEGKKYSLFFFSPAAVIHSILVMAVICLQFKRV